MWLGSVTTRKTHVGEMNLAPVPVPEWVGYRPESLQCNCSIISVVAYDIILHSDWDMVIGGWCSGVCVLIYNISSAGRVVVMSRELKPIWTVCV